MRFPLILPLAWDDRRHTWRSPSRESGLSAAQRYFRVVLACLGGGFAFLLLLASILVFFAVTGR